MLRAIFLSLLVVLAAAPSALAASRVSVADPAGGPRWTAEQRPGAGGATCVHVRRGTAAPSRTCAALSPNRIFAYDVRRDAGPDPRSDRTVYVVSFAANVESATLRTADGTRTYRRRQGRPRVLLAVLAGYVERAPLTVRARLNGRRKVARSVPVPAARAEDPAGAAGWRTRTSGAACVGWERIPPRFADVPEPARGASRCGEATTLMPVAAAQVVGGRVVIFGVVSARADSVKLRLPDATVRTLAVEPSTRSFIAVLAGDAVPEGLRVVVQDGDLISEGPPDVVG